MFPHEWIATLIPPGSAAAQKLWRERGTPRFYGGRDVRHYSTNHWQSAQRVLNKFCGVREY